MVIMRHYIFIKINCTWIRSRPPYIRSVHIARTLLIEDEKKILNEIKIKKMFDLCACERHTVYTVCKAIDMRWHWRDKKNERESVYRIYIVTFVQRKENSECLKSHAIDGDDISSLNFFFSVVRLAHIYHIIIQIRFIQVKEFYKITSLLPTLTLCCIAMLCSLADAEPESHTVCGRRLPHHQ